MVASPLHIVVTVVGIIIFEYIYGMDFSFLGFIVCATVLGLGKISGCTVHGNNVNSIPAETLSS